MHTSSTAAHILTVMYFRRRTAYIYSVQNIQRPVKLNCGWCANEELLP